MGVLRLLLALSVVYAHTHSRPGTQMVDGSIAVETFFIISGFYMALVLNEKYKPLPSFAKAYKLFITSRILRLFPVYLVVLAATFGLELFWLHHPAPKGQTPSDFAPALPYWADSHLSRGSAVFLGLTNLLMLGQDAVMFLAVRPHSGALYFTPDFMHQAVPAWHFLLIPQAWSLGLELSFYLLAPFLARRRPAELAVLALLGFGLRHWMFRHGFYHDPWSYRFFPTELPFFLVGALGYRSYRYLKDRSLLRPVWERLALACALLAILLFHHSPLHTHPLVYFAVLACAVPLVFSLTKNSRWDRWIGELSFPLYSSHLLVILILHHGGHMSTSTAFLAALAAAVFLMLVVDQPVEKLRQGWIARRKAADSLALGTAAGLSAQPALSSR